jgi:hypothetical protein
MDSINTRKCGRCGVNKDLTLFAEYTKPRGSAKVGDKSTICQSCTEKAKAASKKAPELMTQVKGSQQAPEITLAEYLALLASHLSGEESSGNAGRSWEETFRVSVADCTSLAKKEAETENTEGVWERDERANELALQISEASGWRYV